MATMVFVTEVPMLEPMMTGTADLTSSTGGGGIKIYFTRQPFKLDMHAAP